MRMHRPLLATHRLPLLLPLATIVGCGGGVATAPAQSVSAPSASPKSASAPQGPQATPNMNADVAANETQEESSSHATALDEDRFVTPSAPGSGLTSVESTSQCLNYGSFEDICASVQPQPGDAYAPSDCYPFACQVSTLARQGDTALYDVSLAPNTDLCVPSQRTSVVVVEYSGELWIAQTLESYNSVDTTDESELVAWYLHDATHFTLETTRQQQVQYHDDPYGGGSEYTDTISGYWISAQGVFFRGSVDIGTDAGTGPRRVDTDLEECRSDCESEAKSQGMTTAEDLAYECAWQCADGWSSSAEPAVSKAGVTTFYSYPLAGNQRWPNWQPESNSELHSFKHCAAADAGCELSCLTTPATP